MGLQEKQIRSMLLEISMSKPFLTIRIPQREETLDHIKEALAEYINTITEKIDDAYTPAIKDAVALQIVQQPEMQDLLTGPLDGVFGVPAGTASARVAAITESVAESVFVKWFPVPKDFRKGGLIVRVQPSSFANLLALEAGKVNAIHKTDGAYTMHWLEWLLERGDEPIVQGYDYKPQSGKGRSRKGIMEEDSAAVWRVPPEYSGTEDDNFVTRALQSDIMINELKEILKLVLLG